MHAHTSAQACITLHNSSMCNLLDFYTFSAPFIRLYIYMYEIWGCIHKFLDWPPGARTANGTALCHYMQLYCYFMSLPSEFCHHNPLHCCSMSAYYCHLFHYWLSLETFGYTLVCVCARACVLFLCNLCTCRTVIEGWDLDRQMQSAVNLFVYFKAKSSS
jgi:hypothetical protein